MNTLDEAFVADREEMDGQNAERYVTS
jgi:hypothetical protein